MGARIFIIAAVIVMHAFLENSRVMAADILKLTKDTVYENGMKQSLFKDSCHLVNLTSSAQTVDTVMALVDPVKIPEFELDFLAYSQDNSFSEVYQLGSHFPQNNKIIIKAADSLILRDFNIDLCIACPTAKRLATAKLGDTMTAKIVFKTKNDSDTLTLIGIQQVASTSIGGGFNSNERMEPTTRADHATSSKFYNTLGREIPLTLRRNSNKMTAVHGIYIAKESKMIQVK